VSAPLVDGTPGAPSRTAGRWETGPVRADRREAMGRRWVHRRGVLFRAELTRPSAPGAVGEVRPAFVRLSSTFGWPRPLPDWAGMGIRVVDADGDHLDLTLVSSASGHELWCQIRTARDPLACSYSTVVRYRIGEADRVVVAVPSAERSARRSATIDRLVAGEVVCPVVFHLAAGDRPGDWRPLGDLVLIEPIDDDPTLRFRPPKAGPPLLTRLRARVYAWSRS
jgi:hypothetical protein